MSKRLCNGETSSPSGEFSWEAQPGTPLAPGEPFRLRLEEHLVAGRGEHFLGDLCSFFDFIRARFGRDRDLEGEALDAIARNATRDEHGAFHLFDLEWRARSGVPVSWWILRNVLSCVEMRGSPIPDLPHGRALYEALCARLGAGPQLAGRPRTRGRSGRRRAQHCARGGGPRASPPSSKGRGPFRSPLGLEDANLGFGSELATAHRRLIADYQQLESWAMQLQATQATAIAEYRRLEAWAKKLETELQNRAPGAQP